MEAWIGEQWHRLVTRAAERGHPQAAVTLPEMQRALQMLFRAGGGEPALRVAPAADARVGGPRSWLQRVAGTGTHAARARLDTDVLALPACIDVFAQPELNRALYLWLAALAAHWPRSGAAAEGWITGNVAATSAALAAFPGLAARHRALTEAHLAQRPHASTLKGEAVAAEQAVRQALRGEATSAAASIRPEQVAPVWLWLDAPPPGTETPPARQGEPGEPTERQKAPAADTRRRRAERVNDDRHRAPLMMFFRAESLLSWGEFAKVQRASDDSDDGQALAAAADMDRLSVAEGGQTCASRVKFDLDLPSAAADDTPLGPAETQPEWDWKRRRLLPEHCRVQRLVRTDAPAFEASPALRRTARRVRRRMEAWRSAPGRVHGQADGDELDLDAWVRHHVDAAAAPRPTDPAVFVRRQSVDRSLATLLLADLSLSTDAYATSSARVIDVIRDALFVFGEALAASGDPFEMLGFSSVRRQQVRIQHLKGFDEPWGVQAQARVGAIRPGFYTRLGAAIRHASARLESRPERQRLLLILTDGKPNDLDVYEGRWGLEDTRHAVQAARAQGLTPFCVTIDAQAHDYLPHLFGRQGWAQVHRPQELVTRLAGVHAALAGRRGPGSPSS